jgi:hypothetical protein
VEKVSNSEFDLLCEIGNRHATECKTKVEDFFWKIISNAASYKSDVVDQAV